MQFFISKYHTTNNIESIYEKGESMLFFMGNSFAFSMPFKKVIKTGKNAGQYKEYVQSIHFTYFLDFDFHENNMNLTFHLVPDDQETESFCSFSKKTQVSKDFEQKNTNIQHRSETIFFERSYISRLDSSDTQADIKSSIENFLKEEIHKSIDTLERRICSNKIVNLDVHNKIELAEEIKKFHHWADVFINEKIPQEFQEDIDLYEKDYMKNKLDKGLTLNSIVMKKTKI